MPQLLLRYRFKRTGRTAYYGEKENNMKKRYEHAYITVSMERIGRTLCEYEDAGWELASAVPCKHEISDRELFILFFKRPVEESGDF